MSRRHLLIAAFTILILLLSASGSRAGFIYAPEAVIRNDYGAGPGSPVSRLIDGTGLLDPFVSGVDDYAGYIASNPNHLGGFVSPFHWYSDVRPKSFSGVIDFDMGARRRLESLAYFSNDFFAANRIEVFAANEASFTDAVKVGEFVPLYGAAARTTLFTTGVQDIDLLDTTARYVRFSMPDGFRSPSSNPNAAIFSMSEVGFGMTAVPEPSTIVLVGLVGSAGMASGRWRRRRRSRGTTHPPGDC